MMKKKTGLSEDTITLLSTVLDAKLPKPYATWLIKSNGTLPEKLSFHFHDLALGRDDDTSIQTMFAVNAAGGQPDIIKERRVFFDRLPKELLVFGDDALGNQLCLAISGKKYGQVFFYRHDNDTAGDPWPGCSPLATSFDAFLDALI